MEVESMNRNPNLLTTEQAAYELGLSPETLTTWRCRNRDRLRFIKMGSKVFYQKQDVLLFYRKQLQLSADGNAAANDTSFF
jgi:hypothetical protein